MKVYIDIKQPVVSFPAGEMKQHTVAIITNNPLGRQLEGNVIVRTYRGFVGFVPNDEIPTRFWLDCDIPAQMEVRYLQEGESFTISA